MPRFCTSCGREVPVGLRFCPECGAEQVPVPASPPMPAVREAGEEVVGTGAFWGLTLLYAIPVVGFICSIIFSLVPENRNIRHHALAILIWKLICAALLALTYLMIRPVLLRTIQSLFTYIVQD